MSIQFKKFLCFASSLVLTFITLEVFVKFYANAVGGNSFGGELVLFGPFMLLGSIFFYYFLLKKIFKIY
jgi:hypothetical protein